LQQQQQQQHQAASCIKRILNEYRKTSAVNFKGGTEHKNCIYRCD